jgi:hypothetical protein
VKLKVWKNFACNSRKNDNCLGGRVDKFDKWRLRDYSTEDILLRSIGSIHQCKRTTLNQSTSKKYHTMTPDKYWKFTLLSILLDLFDEIIDIPQRFISAAGDSPITLFDGTFSEATLIPTECFYPAVRKLGEYVVVTFDIFAETVDENE